MERISPRRRIPRSVGSLMLKAFVVCLVVSHSSSSTRRTVILGDGAFDEVADQLEVFFSHVSWVVMSVPNQEGGWGAVWSSLTW